MLTLLTLLVFHGPFGGPHAGPGHFPGFFFCGPVLFWSLLIGVCVVATLSRQAARPVPSPPAGGRADEAQDGQAWPDIDPAPPARQRAGENEGDNALL